MPKVVKYYESKAAVARYEEAPDFTEEAALALAAKREPEVFQPFGEGKEGEDEAAVAEGAAVAEPPASLAAQREEEQSLARALEEARSELERLRQEASEILSAASAEVESLRREAQEEGRREGYDSGYTEGYRKAYEETATVLEQKSRAYLDELAAMLEGAEAAKAELLQKHLRDLTNLAVAVAEKVIHVGLKSSGEVMEKMIISATEKLKRTQWAKIYLAGSDANRMAEGDEALIQALSRLSDQVKIIAMENVPSGTCIIEVPDEIIDASVSTQMDNIREIIGSAK